MNKEILENRYNYLCQTPSAINEHIPTLRKYAEECNVVVEFGTWKCESTTALVLGAKEKVISCDHLIWGEIDKIEKEIKYFSEICGDKFTFIKTDTKSPNIFTECDLLFIDTYHNYNQVKIELELYGNKSKRYIIFHDTVSFGEIGDDGQVGLLKGIYEFLEKNKEWNIEKHFLNNNGLLILKKNV